MLELISSERHDMSGHSVRDGTTRGVRHSEKVLQAKPLRDIQALPRVCVYRPSWSSDQRPDWQGRIL